MRCAEFSQGLTLTFLAQVILTTFVFFPYLPFCFFSIRHEIELFFFEILSFCKL